MADEMTSHEDIFSLIDLSEPSPPPTPHAKSPGLHAPRAVWQLLLPRPIKNPDPTTIELPPSPPPEKKPSRDHLTVGTSEGVLSAHTSLSAEPSIGRTPTPTELSSMAKLNPKAASFNTRRLSVRVSSPLSFFPGDSTVAIPPHNSPVSVKSPQLHSNPSTPSSGRFWHRETLEHQPLDYGVDDSWGLASPDQAGSFPHHTFDGKILVADRGDHQHFSLPAPSKRIEIRAPTLRAKPTGSALSSTSSLDTEVLEDENTSEFDQTIRPVDPSVESLTRSLSSVSFSEPASILRQDIESIDRSTYGNDLALSAVNPSSHPTAETSDSPTNTQITAMKNHHFTSLRYHLTNLEVEIGSAIATFKTTLVMDDANA